MKKVLIAAALSTLLTGCATNAIDPNAPVTGTGPLAQCDLPTVKENAPIRQSMYVTGTFSDGQWMHQKHRKMSYKGDGIYQVVMDNEAGALNFQFAAMSWTPQYSASGYSMKVAEEAKLIKGGYLKDTTVVIPKAGKYVWSFQVSEDKKPVKAMISMCPTQE